MENEKQAVVVNGSECWPCAVCRQFAEADASCKAGRTTVQCSKEIASNDGRLPMFMLKDPFFEEGREAFDGGTERSDCPYGDGTDGEHGWLLGWRQAQLDDYAKANAKDEVSRATAEMHRCLLTGRYTEITDQDL